MQDPSLAIKELERCKSIGLKGIQIGSNVNQKNLGEPEFYDIFKACEQLGMCVFVHPWEMMGEKEMQKYWLPWLVGMPAETTRAICSLIFSGVLEKLPNLRIAFAHGGGSFPFTLGRIKHGFDCRPDLVAIDNNVDPTKYLGQVYFDSLVHDIPSLKYLIARAGIDKVALGSDYPFPLGENRPGGLIKSSDFRPEEMEWLLNRSALNWLGLSKANFNR
jgi:aminocarboxymuconate-semialdehyde decarboxylase